jgi:outer membrane protein, heavy metal efflux system
MSWTKHFALSGVLLSATMGSAAGAFEAFPLTGDPVLEALVSAALQESPELRAAEASVAAARSRIPRAGALPDPVATVGYQNGGHGWAPGADDDTGLGIAVSQELPFAGKRRLAEEVETREAERALHLANQVRLNLVYRVRLGYARVLLARENLAILSDQSGAIRDIEELTRSRYAVGLAGQSDVLRAQAEAARLEQARLHEEGLETSAIAELNRLLARPAGTPVEPGERLVAIADRPLRAPSLEDVLAAVEASSPQVAADAAMVARSAAAVELARRQAKPDFVASASYLNRGSIPGMFAVDVGVVVPLYRGRKQGQAVAEAEARLRSDQAQREAMGLRARAEAEKSLADLRAALGEAQAYAAGVLAVDALAVESAIAGFQAGKTPFVTVLEAHGALYKDRWQYADLLFHVLWHGARLDALTLEE